MLLEDREPRRKPNSELEKKAVWRQVDRLLSDPSFNRSKRYPSLLRFIVSHALDGDTDSLKERILGIEVFGRRPDYDSTQDPIVRVTAAEVRKRIVRYYEDSAHQTELRLWLPSGSYVPHFELALTEEDTALLLVDKSSTTSMVESTPAQTVPGRPSAARRPLRAWFAAILAVMLVAILGMAYAVSLRHRDTLGGFWGPIFKGATPILICTADQDVDHPALMDAAHPLQPATVRRDGSTISTETLSPVVDLTNMLGARGIPHKIQTQSSTTFNELGAGPLVLVGAFNNFWTLQLTKPLRFHLSNDPTFNQFWITDSENPQLKKWTLDATVKEPSEGYALVVRYFEPYTRQWTVVIAGLGAKSNISALRFVLSPQYLADLDQATSQDWRNKNLEVVVKTHIINGNAGPPMIDAVYVW